MKRFIAVLFIAIFLPAMPLSGMAESNSDPGVLQQEADEQLQKELGAFEITAHQREIAKTNEAGYPVLDAGRGNPNWISAPDGTVRISLANLNEEDYVEIAQRLFELLDDYYSEYETYAMSEAA